MTVCPLGRPGSFCNDLSWLIQWCCGPCFSAERAPGRGTPLDRRRLPVHARRTVHTDPSCLLDSLVHQDKYVWRPFQPNEGDFNTDWWERRQPSLELDDPWYVQVVDDELAEVVRIELDDKGFATTYFVGAPRLGDERLEIQFFEVSARRR